MGSAKRNTQKAAHGRLSAVRLGVAMAMVFDASKLAANMDAIRARIITEGARKAVKAGAVVIGDAMRERTPVLAERHRTGSYLDPGELKANITERAETEDGKPIQLVGPNDTVAHVALWVEYGHRDVKGGYSHVAADGKFRGPGRASAIDVPAHPFLRPAFEASAESALKAMAEVYANELKEVM